MQFGPGMAMSLSASLCLQNVVENEERVDYLLTFSTLGGSWLYLLQTQRPGGLLPEVKQPDSLCSLCCCCLKLYWSQHTPVSVQLPLPTPRSG